MEHKTYETLIFSNVFSIASYSAGVSGFKEHSNSRVLQNSIIRYYLGTHRFTPLAALYTEMDWPLFIDLNFELLNHIPRGNRNCSAELNGHYDDCFMIEALKGMMVMEGCVFPFWSSYFTLRQECKIQTSNGKKHTHTDV